MSDYSDTMQSYLDACEACPPACFPYNMTFSLGLAGQKRSVKPLRRSSTRKLMHRHDTSSTVFKSPEFDIKFTQWYILPESASPFAKSVFDFAPLAYSPKKGATPYNYWSAMCLLVKYKEISAAFRKSSKSIHVRAANQWNDNDNEDRCKEGE